MRNLLQQQARGAIPHESKEVPFAWQKMTPKRQPLRALARQIASEHLKPQHGNDIVTLPSACAGVNTAAHMARARKSALLVCKCEKKSYGARRLAACKCAGQLK